MDRVLIGREGRPLSARPVANSATAFGKIPQTPAGPRQARSSVVASARNKFVTSGVSAPRWPLSLTLSPLRGAREDCFRCGARASIAERVQATGARASLARPTSGGSVGGPWGAVLSPPRYYPGDRARQHGQPPPYPSPTLGPRPSPRRRRSTPPPRPRPDPAATAAPPPRAGAAAVASTDKTDGVDFCSPGGAAITPGTTGGLVARPGATTRVTAAAVQLPRTVSAPLPCRPGMGLDLVC